MLSLNFSLQANTNDWPPEKSKVFPEIEFLDVNGKIRRISEFRNQIVLIRYIAFTCPACHGFSGGNKTKTKFHNISPQPNLQTMDDYFNTYSGFKDHKIESVVKVINLVLMNEKEQQPSVKDLKEWKKYFSGLTPSGKNAEYFVTKDDYATPGTKSMIPGAALLDKNGILKSIFGNSNDDLYTVFLPKIKQLQFEDAVKNQTEKDIRPKYQRKIALPKRENSLEKIAFFKKLKEMGVTNNKRTTDSQTNNISKKRVQESNKFYIRGKEYHKNGNYIKAIKNYQIAIKRNYLNLKAHEDIASIQLFNTNEHEKGKLKIKELIEINPYNKRPYTYLANFHKKSDNFVELLNVYKNAIRNFPENKDFIHELGMIYKTMGNIPMAKKNFYKAYKLSVSEEHKFYYIQLLEGLGEETETLYNQLHHNLLKKKYQKLEALMTRDLGRKQYNQDGQNTFIKEISFLSKLKGGHEMLKEWSMKMPNSKFASALYAGSLITWAYEARGNGFSQGTNPEALSTYKKRINLSHQILLKDIIKNPKNLINYYFLLVISKDVKMSVIESTKYLNFALAIDPKLFLIKVHYMFNFSYIWQRDLKTYFSFAIEEYKKSKNQTRSMLLIVNAHDGLAGHKGIKDTYFLNHKLRKKINQIYKEAINIFPNSNQLLCFQLKYAYLTKEKSLAKRVFRRIKNKSELLELFTTDFYNKITTYALN
ncbi:MAG: tetratricopeptide (TPR) repeat protein [Bacteriovoracaceae bacterium]